MSPMYPYLAACLLFLFQLDSSLAQSIPSKWQVEASLDYMTHGDHMAFQILYPDYSELIMANGDKTTFYFSVTRLFHIAGRFALRYGVSISDKGYVQDFSFRHPANNLNWSWHTRRQLYYAGIPVLVSLNTLQSKRKFSGFVELGILPEFLILNKVSYDVPVVDILEYNFRTMGLSGSVHAGLQFKLSDSVTLLTGPQVRFAFTYYDGENIKTPIIQYPAFRPFSIGLGAGLRF